MRTRSIVLALIGALTAGSGALLACADTQMQAETKSVRRFAARDVPARALPGEPVKIKGTVGPERRPLVLQRRQGDRWRNVDRTRTGDRGKYTFGVTASSDTAVYRAFAPRVSRAGHEHPARVSKRVRVTPARARAAVSVVAAPVGQTRAGGAGTIPGEAVFSPRRPGTPVEIQQRTDGRWRALASGKQTPKGTFTFQLRNVDLASGNRFRAIGRPAPGTRARSAPVTAGDPWRQVWADEFSGSALDPGNWQTREQERGGRRKCASPDDDRVRVRNGFAELSIKRVARTRACPDGVFDNAMIGTEPGPAGGFATRYGIFAARVMFQRGQGMHGSFWLQGPSVTGAEIDVAEYFGDGRSDGGLSAFVHHTGATGKLSTSGGIQPYGHAIKKGKDPSDGWHVYSVEWSPSGYVFRLDGATIFRTRKPHISDVDQVMILSLLTSDYEIPLLQSTTPTMKVDWVRAWQR